jgi:hypothetical protein
MFQCLLVYFVFLFTLEQSFSVDSISFLSVKRVSSFYLLSNNSSVIIRTIFSLFFFRISNLHDQVTHFFHAADDTADAAFIWLKTRKRFVIFKTYFADHPQNNILVNLLIEILLVQFALAI